MLPLGMLLLPPTYLMLGKSQLLFWVPLMQARATACTLEDGTARSFLTNIVKFDLISFFCHFFL